MRCCPSFASRGIVGAIILAASPVLLGQEATNVASQLDEVREQNRLLQNQLQQQQRTLEDLTRQFSNLQRTSQQQQTDYQDLKASVEGTDSAKKSGVSIGNVVISGEGGVGYFDSQKSGAFPNGDLRVDEARLFVDATLMEDTYFYGEIDLQTREQGEGGVYLGELYVDFENLSKYWGRDNLVNFRAGELYTPFGEEYQNRFAIDNPLISHSLSDVWSLEGGAEAYGLWKKWSYALAVQSGDLNLLHDQTSDKTIAGRIGFDPTSHLHFSLSGQRSGSLHSSTDPLSGIWFGNAFFMPIGQPFTTSYHVNMGEADGRYSWNGGYAAAAFGYAGYGDNNSTGHDHRDIYYYYAEGSQNIWKKLYGAARLSQILAPGGYPISGGSDEFGVEMENVWRLSLGLGYKFSEHLIVKTEYTFEHGMRHDGSPRGHDNLFAIEAAFKF